MKKHILSLLLLGSLSIYAFAQNYYVSEDFNAGTLPTGWTNTAVSGTVPFLFGIDGAKNASVGGSGISNINGTKFVYFDDDSLGNSSKNNTVALTTPAFDNSSAGATYLEFDYNFYSYNAVSDSFYVDVYDGTKWNRVMSLSTSNCGKYDACSTFPHAFIDISSIKSTATKVRFTYHDGNDWAFYVGFDNVEIWSPYPTDLGVTAIVGPLSGCGLTSKDTIKVKIKSFGTSTVNSYDVSYTVNGGTATTESINTPLAAGDSVIYKFSGTANLSTIGGYDIVAYTSFSADSAAVNDTAKVHINNEPSYIPTYNEDFELSDGGWKVSGQNPSWQRGVPGASVINSAPSGTKIFTTNLLGGYNSNEYSYLTSPCFDFSSSIGDPIMTFSLNYQLEANYDNAWMEYSLDNGVSWTKLMAGGVNPSNWYNKTTTNEWNGYSQGWLNVENVLIGMAGQPQVKFRMVIKTDGGNSFNGIGFDKFSIRDPQPVDLSLNIVEYPVSVGSPICGYGSSENIIVKLENKGANNIDTMYVFYQVDNGPIYSDSLRLTLMPNSIIQYSFKDKYDFSSLRNYHLDVWVEAPRDGFRVNDTIANTTVSNSQNVPVKTIPYFETFDAFQIGDPTQYNWSHNTSGNNYKWSIETGCSAINSFYQQQTGPCEDHTTSTGNYANLNSYNEPGAVANLETPCFDLSANSGVILNFWYYRFGAATTMSDLYVDVYDGRSWNQEAVISKRPQTGNYDDWTNVEINLNSYAGRRIKIRFRGVNKGNYYNGDMAIDDIRLYEPIPVDAKMLGVIAPVGGCNVSDSSEIVVEVFNSGSKDILPDSMTVGYQVDTGKQVVETFRQLLGSDLSTTFTFKTKADLSDAGRSYNIKTWVDLEGDKISMNDTNFKYKATNFTKVTNYFEDFESFRTPSCNSAIGQVVENGWIAELNHYSWMVQNTVSCRNGLTATPDGGTGPLEDHTTGQGNFLYTGVTTTPTLNLIDTAFFLSPCLNLLNNTNLSLSFWYHRYGSTMGKLKVQIRNPMDKWVTVLTLSGQEQTAGSDDWKIVNVDLDSYVGYYTQIRFVGYNGGAKGNMAIDDIHLYERINKDIGVVEIISPAKDNSCTLPNNATVKVKIKNFGMQSIPANSIVLSYTNNNLQLARDTIGTTIPKGGSLTHTFTKTVDLSKIGPQKIRVWTTLAGDNVVINNSLERLIINKNVGLPYYFQNFETFEMGANYGGDNLQGWTRNPNGSGHTWHVWQGPSPLIDGDPMPPPIPANGPSGDHTFASPLGNGNGMYMLTETGFRRGGWPDANLETPCGGIDFSISKSNRILLSFYYHMFGGNTGDLFIDVYDGTQWVKGVSVIRGVQQIKATDRWLEKNIPLNNFAHVTNGKIRFRADYIGKIGGGDIGIDDLTLLDQDTIDMTVKEFVKPKSDCNTSNQEIVKVRVQNTGFTNIYKINMGYQVTFFPINGDPIEFPIVKDSILRQVVPLAYYKFEFRTRANLSQPGRYRFKVWSEIPGDNYGFNDTLIQDVENTTKPFPYCEDFSTLMHTQRPKDFLGEILPNNWKGNATPSQYVWKANIEGGDIMGLKGHTSGINDVFLLLNDADGMPPAEAWIQTSCFDLTSTKMANLEFYYQNPNPRSNLLIEIRTVGGGAWQVLDTLYGKALPDWTFESFVLSDFVGNFVEFRLTGTNVGGGYYAIDDFCLVVPPPQQLELEQIVSPEPDRCYYSPNEEIRLRIQNIGIDRIDSFRVVFKMDSTTKKYPAGEMYNDTFWVFPTNPTFDPGDKMDLILDSTYFMEAKTSYYMNVYIYLPGDIDTMGNIIENYKIEHPIPQKIPYVIDFEDPQDPLNGLLFAASGMKYGAAIKKGRDKPTQITGPGDDHTFQNGTGHYFVTQADVGELSDWVLLQTICVDLSEALQPELQYWYHRYGYEMGNFYVQVNDDYGWKTVDSLKGQDQINFNRPWKMRRVKLNHPGKWNYSGKYVRIRFISYWNGSMGDMGLDDIFIFDRAAKDIAPHTLTRPNSSIYSCYTDTQSVIVALRNNGATKLDFTEDSTDVTVVIKKDGVNWDTLHTLVKTNRFKDGMNQVKPLPVDSIVHVKMDGTFDMSEKDALFEFEVYTDMISEALRRNDTINEAVVSQLDSGKIVFIEPTDTVCFGTPIRLTVDEFFGALKWQEKELDANGNGFWMDGLSFPNDSPSYVTLLDTATELRVQVCRATESLPVKVNITKPYSGKAVNVSNCDSAYMIGSIEFPYYGPNSYSNIDSVFIYSSIDSNGYETISQGMGKPSLSGGKLVYPVDFGFIGETDTLWVGSKIDSCFSPLKTPVIASINKFPEFNFSGGRDSICQDTSLILNAGGVKGHQFKYDWTIVNPDGTIEKDTNQTIVVDGWKLKLNETYRYTVVVVSDSGCTTDKSGPNDTLYVHIDSCVTGLDEAHFGEAFNIYPNPTNNVLNVEYRSFNDLVGTIKLISMEGKLLEEHTDVNFRMEAVRFEMDKYAKGIYFIKIETDLGVIVRKVIRS